MDINKKSLYSVAGMLFWLSPIINELWISMLIKIHDPGLHYAIKETVVDGKGALSLCVDFLVFFVVLNILFKYLYLFLVHLFANRYKSITLLFVLFTVSAILVLDYIFAVQRTAVDYLIILLSFIPFYIAIYLKFAK